MCLLYTVHYAVPICKISYAVNHFVYSVCVCTYMYIYIYIYMCVCVCVSYLQSICFCKHAPHDILRCCSTNKKTTRASHHAPEFGDVAKLRHEVYILPCPFPLWNAECGEDDPRRPRQTACNEEHTGGGVADAPEPANPRNSQDVKPSEHREATKLATKNVGPFSQYICRRILFVCFAESCAASIP